MGSYTANLFKKDRVVDRPKKPDYSKLEPRLVGCFIKRNYKVHQIEKGSHYAIRESLGDILPHKHQPGDEEGFVVSDGRLVGRNEACIIANNALQTQRRFGPLTSDDITW